MSKITRQTLQPFGSTGPTDDFEQFGSTEGGSPNFTKAISTLQSLSAWLTGWRAALVTAKAPVLQDMNAVCYVFGYMLSYLLQQGIPEYDSGTTYFQNSIVMKASTNEIYSSAIDDNVGNALPVQASSANWTYMGTLQSLFSSGSYRRPNLIAVSGTTCTLETGISNGVSSANAAILFPNGYTISDGTTGHIVLDMTRVASLGASPQSGLRTGTVANNTWYAVYAVQANSGANFVLVADTVLPIKANYATLNSNFGTNGWVYLGMIRNGDASGTATGILPFTQSGNRTTFINVTDGGHTGFVSSGIKLATTAGATTLSYAYGGGTGTTQIPNQISLGTFAVVNAAVASYVSVANSAGTKGIIQFQGNASQSTAQRLDNAVGEGILLSNGASSSIAYDIWLTGFVDAVLGVGPNPQI